MLTIKLSTTSFTWLSSLTLLPHFLSSDQLFYLHSVCLLLLVRTSLRDLKFGHFGVGMVSNFPRRGCGLFDCLQNSVQSLRSRH